MNTSLLIVTCDSYSFLWENLTTLNNRYLEFDKKIVACESTPFDYEGYTSVLAEGDPWGSRFLKAVNEVSTDFVFVILDDYYFTKKFDKEFFTEVENLLETTRYNKYCLDCTNYPNYALFPFRDNLYIQHSSSEYLTTLQPSVWRVEYLKKIIDPNYSPWDFELTGTAKNRNYNNKIFMELYEDKFYFNAVRRGKNISQGWEEVKDREKLKELYV
jgi:hypothetical protein